MKSCLVKSHFPKENMFFSICLGSKFAIVFKFCFLYKTSE